MAEQKIDDSTLPPARRAVRPFVGPAGSVSAAGPLLRPTGPAGPASRPNPAPFAPPLAPRRAALGTAPSVGAPEPATASVRPPTPARSFDLTVAEPMLARPSEDATPASATFTANEPASVSHSYAVDAAAVDSDIVESTAPLEPELVQSIVVEPSPRRPVTSEMVAIDAFEAFDAVWGPSNTPQASPVVSTTAFSVDAESLDSALDGTNP